MDHDHGKNSTRRDTSPVNVLPKSHEESPGTIAARIQSSASGLVRQAILRPSASSVTGELASAAADAGKAAPGSSSAGPSQSTIPSVSSLGQSSSFQDSTDPTGSSGDRESFRSQPQYNKNIQYSNEFRFQDFMSQASGSSFAGTPSGLEKRKDLTFGEERLVLQPHLSSANIQARSAIQRNPLSKVRGPTNNDADGAAVVALLSEPELFADEAPTNFPAFDPVSITKTNIPNLQPNTEAAAPLSRVSAISPLDLLPDYKGSQEGNNKTTSTKLATTISDPPEGHMYDGSPLQSRDGELQPWLDMLNRYQDEVWGDMLPLVQEAREEAKAAKGRVPDNQPATRRLRMLLQHLK